MLLLLSLVTCVSVTLAHILNTSRVKKQKSMLLISCVIIILLLLEFGSPQSRHFFCTPAPLRTLGRQDHVTTRRKHPGSYKIHLAGNALLTHRWNLGKEKTLGIMIVQESNQQQCVTMTQRQLSHLRLCHHVR